MQLLLGAGNSRQKRMNITGGNPEFDKDLITLDIDSNTGCDVVWDLEMFPYPFDDDMFDEIHAYEVLEHTGAQGDWKFFFDQFSELHRILRPDGLLFVQCPAHDSVWAWGDPSHKRIISQASLTFLCQAEYEKQVGKTAMSDFRFYWKKDFLPVFMKREGDSFMFVLQKK